MQKSRSFIFPMMKFHRKAIYDEVICTYLGHVGYEGLDNWGKYFYIEYNLDDLNEKDLDELRDHPQYVIEFNNDNGNVFFVYKITDKQHETIVKPFLEGKYSEIDRGYAKSHFKQYKDNGEVSLNWRILHKDEWKRPSNMQSIRDYWKDLIGIPLPADAEVWSRPEKRDEIYGYKEYLIDCRLEQELSGVTQEEAIPISEN